MRKVILFSLFGLLLGILLYTNFGGEPSTGIDQQLIDLVEKLPEW